MAKQERLEYNRKIITLLSTLVESFPNHRFGQILFNNNVVIRDEKGNIQDPFYTESKDMYERISQTMIPIRK